MLINNLVRVDNLIRVDNIISRIIVVGINIALVVIYIGIYNT